MSSQERSSSVLVEEKRRNFTGMVHRFESSLKFLQIKSTEVWSIGKNLLAEAYNKNRLVTIEGCFNRLCGAPPSAHVMASPYYYA